MSINVEVLTNAYPLEVKDLEKGGWYQESTGTIFLITNDNEPLINGIGFCPQSIPYRASFSLTSTYRFREMLLQELTLRLRQA